MAATKDAVETTAERDAGAVSPEKTVITHIEDGFDFLGQNVRKYKGKMLIKPSKKNVQTFLEKVRGIIQDNKQATFNSVDRAIFLALWKWARRRHPRKGARWVRQKYFCTLGQRNWVFFGEVTHEEETTRVYLAWTTDTPSERHTKIKEAANPYDPDWETYYEKRLGLKMEHNLRKRQQLLYLWKEQQGLCPHCKQKITKLTGWHSHHIVWRSKGGSDGRENRVLLHPDCHRAIHSQRLTVTKPCSSQEQKERLEPNE